MQTQRSSQVSWWQTWQFWGIFLVLISGGIGFTATSLLLKLPKEQNCSHIYWPIASASIRLYCAQSQAERKNVDDLLQAIALVEVLPQDHPLRGEINRNVEKWAKDILALGEAKFQSGDLEGAITVARKIPEHVQAHQVVEEQIEQWQRIWSKAEETYATVDKQLRNSNWNGAFVWAVRLTNSPNEHWATTKYQETIDKINIAQEERSTLNKAYSQFRQGGLDNLLTALDTVEQIDRDSYAYEDTQEFRAEAKDRLLRTVRELLNAQEWRKLLKITSRVPASLELEEQVKDWTILASAGTSASLDTVYGLEDAIAEAEKLEVNSPLYERGQRLIARWKLEIEDVTHLSKARQLAQGGGIDSYNQAISEARLIPASNPRYADAQREIRKWRNQIQIIEDQPILNRARELAYGGNINSWQRAIAEAQLISSSSPLYSEAQNYINQWRSKIQVIEDQPFLDRAVVLATNNNYAAAIDTAQQIRPGRALYSEAQTKINRWRQEIQALQYLREANAIANRRTPRALAQAIRVARRVSSDTTPYGQVIQKINRWSSQILSIAQTRAVYSLEEAIATARLVPSGTVAHQQAQSQITRWEEQLKPPAIETIPFQLEKPDKKRE